MAFADVTKFKISTWVGFSGLFRWSLSEKLMIDGNFIKQQKMYKANQINLKIKVEIVVSLPQAQGMAANSRRWQK